MPAMAKTETSDPRQSLAEILAKRPDLAAAASAIFDYAQYLLVDDVRLTTSGALDGEGRELLRKRALETLGGPTEDEADDGDDGGDDDGDDEDDK
jgi:hypothetical protein